MIRNRTDQSIGETISIDEVSRRLGVSKPSVYAAIRRGDIPAIRVGERRVVVPRIPFESLLKGNPAGSVEEVAEHFGRAFASAFAQAHAKAMAEALSQLSKIKDKEQ